MRADFCLASYSGSLYAVGGSSDGNDTPTVLVLDGESWITGPSLETSRVSLGVAVLLNDAS